MEIQGLLKRFAVCDYPAEFLAARLLGKKSILFKDWEFLITGSNSIQNLQNTPFFPYLKQYGSSGVWRFLSHEHSWVYSRMDPYLRKTFSAYFVYHEGNTLIVCLRYLESRKGMEAVRQELHSSLLNQSIQNILTSGSDITEILQALELYLERQTDLFNGLQELYRQKGIGAAEIFIRDGFFALIAMQKLPVKLKKFFQQLVDIHNCLFLAKTIRWGIKSEPAMIPGGTIPPDLFKRAYFQKNLTSVAKFLRLNADPGADPAIAGLETALLQSLTRKLKIRSYQRTVIGDILFYLWEQYRYTRNISLILNTALVDDILIREQIVA